jgi:hypothetical protein
MRADTQLLALRELVSCGSTQYEKSVGEKRGALQPVMGDESLHVAKRNSRKRPLRFFFLFFASVCAQITNNELAREAHVILK